MDWSRRRVQSDHRYCASCRPTELWEQVRFFSVSLYIFVLLVISPVSGPDSRQRDIGFPVSYAFSDFARSASSNRATDCVSYKRRGPVTVRDGGEKKKKRIYTTQNWKKTLSFFSFLRVHSTYFHINRERDAAARLLFTIGNEVVTKISQHAMAVAIDKLFLKGRPRECVDDLEKICRRCLNRCVATYFQVFTEWVIKAPYKVLEVHHSHNRLWSGKGSNWTRNQFWPIFGHWIYA